MTDEIAGLEKRQDQTKSHWDMTDLRHMPCPIVFKPCYLVLIFTVLYISITPVYWRGINRLRSQASKGAWPIYKLCQLHRASVL